MTARWLLLMSLAVPLVAGAAGQASAPAAASAASGPAASSAPAAPAPAAASAGKIAPATDMVGATAPAAEAPSAEAPSGVTAPNMTAANTLHPAPVVMPSGSPTGSLLQTLFALILVLGVLGGLAWFLKRYGPKPGGGNANIRMVGSLNLGGRERVLVVEVGGQWIVLGASPGRINALATMPRQEGVDNATATLTAPGATPAAHNFADWLKQTIDKRK